MSNGRPKKKLDKSSLYVSQEETKDYSKTCNWHDCNTPAEFKTKLGDQIGRYCGPHMLEFMQSGSWSSKEEGAYLLEEDLVV